MVEDHPPFRALTERRSHAEKDEILHERGIEPIGTTRFKRNTALIFAGTAMVLGILWVNSGTSQQASNRDLTAPGGAAQERRDIVARNRRLRGGRAAAETAGRRRERPQRTGAQSRSRGSWPRRSDRPCHAARCGARTDRRTGAQPIWRTRRDDRHSSPMAGAISVGRPRKARRRRPRARNRPKIQERQGVRRAGRPMRWIA
jgi:hypothetical protein